MCSALQGMDSQAVVRRFQTLEEQSKALLEQNNRLLEQNNRLLEHMEAQGKRLDAMSDNFRAMTARIEVGAYEGRIERMQADLRACFAPLERSVLMMG